MKARGSTVDIVAAGTGADFAGARGLIEEYAAGLGIDLCFQEFERELQVLDQMYGPPFGCLLLAKSAGRLLACGAIRRLSEQRCEMKRLYVRPQHRNLNLGRRIAEQLVDRAAALGYERIVLDTLESMHAARALYASLGFAQIEPYYANPLAGVVYMGRELRFPAALSD